MLLVGPKVLLVVPKGGSISRSVAKQTPTLVKSDCKPILSLQHKVQAKGRSQERIHATPDEFKRDNNKLLTVTTHPTLIPFQETCCSSQIIIGEPIIGEPYCEVPHVESNREHT